MIKTILRNLAVNALKYSDNDSQIDINASKSSHGVELSIRYGGTGISSDHMARFFDISNINTFLNEDEDKGTTLGLLLCKELVEKHGGRIWVDREKDRMSVFRFTLPAAN